MDSFRVLPESASRTWSIRDLALSAKPIGEKMQDTPYESPIREIKLDVVFMQKQMIEALPYVLDDDAFVPEWEFAHESWNQLIEGVTEVITEYNKRVVARARELHLNTTSVIGKARTVYNKPRDDTRPETNTPIIPTNRVETVYEPSIRSSATRRSAAVRRSPIDLWIASSLGRR